MAIDICKVLGIASNRDALICLKDYKKGVATILTLRAFLFPHLLADNEFQLYGLQILVVKVIVKTEHNFVEK